MHLRMVVGVKGGGSSGGWLIVSLVGVVCVVFKPQMKINGKVWRRR